MTTNQKKPAYVASTGDSDNTIVRAAVHPAIGIARVGDSKTGYFLCPEVLNPPPEDSYRDDKGALKRQAVKFRLFGYNAAGNVVRELSPKDGRISWTVRLANKKAAWYQFRGAFDISETEKTVSPRRNLPIPGHKDSDWIIDSGDCTVRVNGRQRDVRVLAGRFFKNKVELGEIRVVEEGRLLVFGGKGRSESPLNSPIHMGKYSTGNAAGWFDDTADGSVSAKVVIQGKSIPVAHAWVIVAPPNYAPGIKSWRTLYDVLEEAFIRAQWLPKPTAVSFTKHILPKLQRLSNLQWVNAGFAAWFGKGAPADFENPALIKKLAQTPGKSGTDPFLGLRRSIVLAFRPSNPKVDDPRLWPWIYGDGVEFDDFTTPNTYLPLSQLEEERLKSWAEGIFVNDWNPNAYPLQQSGNLPAMLDEAALSDCIADAFHPGQEVSWTIRHVSLFERPSASMPPFRILRRLQAEPDYGPVMNQQLALQPGGPLAGQAPGDITRWLAVPWQADIPYCRSGYSFQTYHPHLPSFWPARVPNHVLKEEHYAVLTKKASRRTLLTAFNSRDFWLREIIVENQEPQTDASIAMTRMLERWSKMGIVQARTGHIRHPSLPEVIHVETFHGKTSTTGPSVKNGKRKITKRRSPAANEQGLSD